MRFRFILQKCQKFWLFSETFQIALKETKLTDALCWSTKEHEIVEYCDS